MGPRPRSLLLTTTLLLLAAACETTSTTDDTAIPTPGDDGGRDGGGSGDDGGPAEGADAGGDGGTGLTAQQEKEPNDGTTASDVNTMTLPGVMAGALDPKGDKDLFALDLAPGELWEWTLTPNGAGLEPHLTVFDTDGNSPTVITTAAAGTPAKLTHFVLATGTWIAAVRDARNVGGGASEGGPSFKYMLQAEKKSASPTAMAVPSTKTGKLSSLYTIDLYSFTLATDTALDVVIRAARKAPASTLDSRLSLFDVGKKKSLGTNDNAGQSTDSQLGGTLPAGDYVAIVENEGTNGADLSYEIEIALR